jgi:hypothetical protein
MSIPELIIQKLNSAFGIIGRPHRLFINGEMVDTGCMEWSPFPSEFEILSEMSADLKDAFQRLQGYLRQETGNQSEVRVAEFFSHEPLALQAEFAELNAKLQKASAPAVEVPPLPDMSPEMKAASARIYERLNHEKFQKGKRFDVDRYFARVRELFKEEPPHIQTELAELNLIMEERDLQIQRISQQQKLTLKKGRTLMQNEPVTVYRDGIEWEGTPSSGYGRIVVAPTTDQFDILRCEQTNGANHGLQTEDVIEKLKMVDETYGIDIVGASWDGVEFVLKQVPKGKKALELGRWLLEICPDLYEAPRSYPKGKVALWWD